jgi:VanZ family protein
MLALIVAWGLTAAIALMTWGPIGMRPQTGHPIVARAMAFLVLATAFYIAYPRRPGSITLGLLLLPIVLEIGQGFVPGRDPRLADALTKLAGVLAAACLLLIWRRLKAARRLASV